MRELTPQETAAAMERKAAAMEQLRAECKSDADFESRDKAGRIPATVKRKGPMVMGQKPSAGYDLAMLLQRAAGLEGFRLRSIECRITGREPVTFKAEIYGTAEDIAAAIAANEEEGQ